MRSRVTDTGLTIQGTGRLMGTPQWFIRLAGCSIGECPIRKQCDEQDSLSFTKGDEMSLDGIVEQAKPFGWLHITGGEPADHPETLKDLARLCVRAGVKTHIQTSGMRELPCDFDFVTVSPKCLPSKLLVRDWGDECCVVYTGQDVSTVASYYLLCRFQHHYLVPLWDNQPNTQAAIEMIYKLRRIGYPFSLSIQSHKYMGIR